MPQRASRLTPAAAVTRAASRQSYLTIRWLADREHRAEAFALYAYFRWLDDMVDEHLTDAGARLALVARQRRLLETPGSGAPGLAPPERLLVGLARRAAADDEPGLALSLRSMLDVMELDARRRGRAVTQRELDGYTHDLAVAVTEALHHCIGHGRPAPHDETRYVAVTGAHVAHMLRDLTADLAAGYVNVPSEVVGDGALAPGALHTPALCDWVHERVALARTCFAVGRDYLARVDSARCRLAGHAYIARFEWVLDAVEREGYRVRAGYPERRSVRGGVAIGAAAARSALAAAVAGPGRTTSAGSRVRTTSATPRRTTSAAPQARTTSAGTPRAAR